MIPDYDMIWEKGGEPRYPWALAPLTAFALCLLFYCLFFK